MRLDTLLPFALVVTTAHAWGDVGHRTVAYLAEKHLSSEAALLFGALLENEQNYDYSDAACWADSVKTTMPWSRPFHYINPKNDTPPKTCLVDYPSDCPKEGCVVSAILNYTSIVLNATNTLTARKNATMFLMHLIGDLHQPLHATGFKTGGNGVEPICWNREPDRNRCPGDLNLHAVWDARIPHKLRGLPQSLDNAGEKKAAASWAADLFSRQRAIQARPERECADIGSYKCIVTWAEESNALVCSHVLRRGETWILKNDLSKAYFDENWEVVDGMIGKAGLRLAAWMNAIAVATSKGTQSEQENPPVGDAEL